MMTIFWCVVVASVAIGLFFVSTGRGSPKRQAVRPLPFRRFVFILLFSGATGAVAVCVWTRELEGVWPTNPAVEDEFSIGLFGVYLVLCLPFVILLAWFLGRSIISWSLPATTSLLSGAMVISSLAAGLLLVAALGGTFLVTSNFKSAESKIGGFYHAMYLSVDVDNAQSIAVEASAGTYYDGGKLTATTPDQLAGGMVGSLSLMGTPGQAAQVWLIADASEGGYDDTYDNPATLSVSPGGHGTILKSPALKACGGSDARVFDIRFDTTGRASVKFEIGSRSSSDFQWSLPVEDYMLVTVPGVLVYNGSPFRPCLGEKDKQVPNATSLVMPQTVSINESAPPLDLGQTLLSSYPQSGDTPNLSWKAIDEPLPKKQLIFRPVYTISTPNSRAAQQGELFFASGFVAVALTMLVELIRMSLREQTASRRNDD